MYETAKETLIYRSVLWTLGEGEGREIWENGIETCIISCMKRVVSPGSTHDTGTILQRTCILNVLAANGII